MWVFIDWKSQSSQTTWAIHSFIFTWSVDNYCLCSKTILSVITEYFRVIGLKIFHSRKRTCEYLYYILISQPCQLFTYSSYNFIITPLSFQCTSGNTLEIFLRLMSCRYLIYLIRQNYLRKNQLNTSLLIKITDGPETK